MFYQRAKLLIVMLWVGFLSSACAPSLRARLDTSYRGRIVFPPPPEKPRIEFWMSIYEILPQGKKLTDILAGSASTEPAYIPIIPRPFGVFVKENTLYIVDNALPRLTRIDLASGRAEHFGIQPSPAQDTPVDLVVDSSDRIYVTDSAVGRVFVYMPDGRFERFLTKKDSFSRPTGIAIDNDKGILYIADTPEHCIKVFDREGHFLKRIGRRGRNPGEFNYPVHLAFRAGKLYVVDSMNFRIQVFDSQGKLLKVFGHLGDTYADLERPKGIGVDSFGNIYIADALQDMIKVFDPEGRLLLFFGNTGRALGNFSMPIDVFVDDKNRIFVADSANMRVQVFRLLEGGERHEAY